MYSKPVSPSGLKLWKECPRKWADCYIEGNRQPSGAAALRGTELHNLLEEFFKGGPYPSGNKTLRPWQKFMEGLATKGGSAESEIAVTSDWSPTKYDDPSANYRGKKDYDFAEGSTLFVYDWKSGNIYDEHEFQADAYLCMSPSGFDTYTGRFVYLDQPHVVHEWIRTAEEVATKREEHGSVIQELRMAEEYPATPGNGCKWCHMSWRRGGDCKRAR